ncbi:protein phosphatase methylesterase 1-like [Artemia franciscana]|uniref:protein phosphatase methylesterase 1-like n=1 Tax=Artemia franciscana TaxID=6661 RepID=UPI0032DB6EC0
MDLRKQIVAPKFLGMPPPHPQSGQSSSKKRLQRRNYSPESWSPYFGNDEFVETQAGKFHVYHGGENAGPLLVMLHGGGYSGLTWSVFNVAITSLVTCQTVAIDMRGHGSTDTTDEENLSSTIMASDVGDVLKALFPDSSPPTVVIGHSMGGAIAVHAAVEGCIPNLIGVVVIDVVEGTAMEALTSMQTFLRGRPNTFPSLDNAIEWCIKSGQTRNLEAAKVSMPGQLKNIASGRSAAQENFAEEAVHNEFITSNLPAGSFAEEDEEKQDEKMEESNANEQEVKKTGYTWRINLSKTEKYWNSWFHGLSNMFLSIPAAKILLLAGIDRLDKDLTVGQMQGKFQMHVLPQCGHAVHEDVPDRVAEVVATFLVRNRFAEAKENFHRPFPCC